MDIRTEENWFKDGMEFCQKGQYEEAENCLNKVIEINTMNLTALLMRGLIRSNLERYDDAMKDYDTAIEIYPNDGLGYLNRGRVNNHHQRWWLEWVAPIRGLKPSIILSFSTYS